MNICLCKPFCAANFYVCVLCVCALCVFMSQDWRVNTAKGNGRGFVLDVNNQERGNSGQFPHSKMLLPKPVVVLKLELAQVIVCCVRIAQLFASWGR